MTDERDDDGKWMASTDEESWSDSARFDTREEARLYAISELAVDNGIDDGAYIYTGQVRQVDLDTIAAAGVDAWSVLEGMTEWLHDNVGEFEVECGPGDEDDLQARLNAAIKQWITDRKITLPYHIDDPKSEPWRRCKGDDEACALHLGHEGDHAV